MNTSATLKIFINVVVWALFFILILSVTTSMGSATFVQQLSSASFFVFCFFYLAIFYGNSLVLFPYLYLKKKYPLYFSIIFLLFIFVFFVTPFDNLLSHPGHTSFPQHMPPPGPLSHDSIHRPPMPRPGNDELGRSHFIDLNSIILFLLVWLASMALQILREWRSSNQRAIIAESDKKTAELAFLKAHINPHFLFNTLNNIYSLAISNHEQTAVSILKLSNIMRYVTESAAVDFIALESELECIVDYVDLQKLRLNKKVYLDFSITGHAEHQKVAPLLLMTFIENIFKYGISNYYHSTIIIKLFIENDTVTFFSQNKIFNAGYTSDREGVGIENAKRRLEFLYPGKHSLDINTDKDLYTVQLTLQI